VRGAADRPGLEAASRLPTSRERGPATQATGLAASRETDRPRDTCRRGRDHDELIFTTRRAGPPLHRPYERPGTDQQIAAHAGRSLVASAVPSACQQRSILLSWNYLRAVAQIRLENEMPRRMLWRDEETSPMFVCSRVAALPSSVSRSGGPERRRFLGGAMTARERERSSGPAALWRDLADDGIFSPVSIPFNRIPPRIDREHV
jgi:hypothetical protein